MLHWCFGQFGLSFYWLTLPLFTDLASFWFLTPISALGIPSVLALIHTTFFAATNIIFRKKNGNAADTTLIFILSWTTAELFRSYVPFGGLPWNLVGHIWTDVPLVLKGVALWGAAGLSFLTLCFFGAIWVAGKKILDFNFPTASLFSILTIAGVTTFWGHIHKGNVEKHPDLFIRLVQPNFPASHHEHGPEHLHHLHQLSNLPAENLLTHLIWPEACLSLYQTSQTLGRPIPEYLPNAPGAPILITGASCKAPHHTTNSLLIIQQAGFLMSRYNKTHLAAFGEFIPGRKWLEKIFNTHHVRALTLGMQDFTPGDGPVSFEIEHTPPFSPFVCFDTAFEGHVAQQPRPEWLLEITNNAWFGTSWGLYQHLNLGRMRAIEEGLPLLRCTNNGVTAVISPYGDIVERLPIGTPGILDTALPKPLSSTPYRLWRKIPFYVGLFFLVAWMLYRRFFYKVPKPKKTTKNKQQK